jgi:mRNA interferase MazF
MRRGEIWWADLPEPAGRRPVLLLSRDAAYKVRSLVTVAPVTRTIRSIPSEVPLGPGDGMPARCVVSLDNIQTVRKDYLKEHLATVSSQKMRSIDEATHFALDLLD